MKLTVHTFCFRFLSYQNLPCAIWDALTRTWVVDVTELDEDMREVLPGHSLMNSRNLEWAPIAFVNLSVEDLPEGAAEVLRRSHLDCLWAAIQSPVGLPTGGFATDSPSKFGKGPAT